MKCLVAYSTEGRSRSLQFANTETGRITWTKRVEKDKQCPSLPHATTMGIDAARRLVRSLTGGGVILIEA